MDFFDNVAALAAGEPQLENLVEVYERDGANCVLMLWRGDVLLQIFDADANGLQIRSPFSAGDCTGRDREASPFAPSLTSRGSESRKLGKCAIAPNRPRQMEASGSRFRCGKNHHIFMVLR